MRFDPESENEAETGEEVQEGFLARIAAVPAVGRARLYRVNEKISDIVTEERRIYGGGQKRRQRFLALVEMASAPLPEKDVCRDLCWQNHQGGKRINMIKNVSDERYWLRFVMQVPDFR